ncbi:PAS domain-containing protein [Prosthecobacter sp.]|uniref:PAS domain-containing protein n=1 Tax=Prosthecobacter sp. TaxID=1965333 RepID=UPI003784FEB7
MSIDPCQVAFSIVNQMHAMMAYWDTRERCLFSNRAYQQWFGKTPEEIASISMHDLLGPELYTLNRPYLQGVMRGEKQIFERTLRQASGVSRRFLATYLPDMEEGVVCGFSVHATELPTLPAPQEWLPICSNCKDIRSPSGVWYPVEEHLFTHSKINFTHGLCPKCLPRYFPACAME